VAKNGPVVISANHSASAVGDCSCANSAVNQRANPRSSASNSAYEWCATRAAIRSGHPCSDSQRAPFSACRPVRAIPGAYPTSCSQADAISTSLSASPRTREISAALAATASTCAHRRGRGTARTCSAALAARSTRSPTLGAYDVPRRPATTVDQPPHEAGGRLRLCRGYSHPRSCRCADVELRSLTTQKTTAEGGGRRRAGAIPVCSVPACSTSKRPAISGGRTCRALDRRRPYRAS
jgi:hypothetical protein